MLLVVGGGRTIAATFEGVPVADTYVWANFPDRNYGSSPHIAFGSASNRYNDDRFQGLIRWEIPEEIRGATVVSARIVFSVRYSRPGGGTIDVYAMNHAWTESATWRTSDGKERWPEGYGALGGTSGEVLSRTEVDEVPPKMGGEVPSGETVVIDASAAVKRWAAGAPNQGLLFRMVHVQYPQCTFDTYSRGEDDPAFGDVRPRLVIEYEAAGAEGKEASTRE